MKLEDNYGSLLIVEDQGGIRKLLYEVFSSLGYEIHLAEDGNQALEIARDNHFDLVLMDMLLPGMSGLEVLSELSSLNKDLSAIMITAYEKDEALKDIENIAPDIGVDYCFSKPFDIIDLQDAVADILSKRVNDYNAV